MSSMVQVQGLTKRFGQFTAVDHISFDVARGEVLGFLGPNGAGKSTTMKMITGFLTPDAGTVIVGGDSVIDHPLAVKRRIGYLPEGAPLYADMTPAGFLSFVAGVRGLRGAQKRRRIDEVVGLVHLEDVLQRRIETLSKGFKRRVGLAQAILHDPEVLILDEPTDGLDPNQKHEVRTLIRSMAEHKAIILSTHILEEVDAVCSRAAIIAAGRMLVDGTPQALQARSRYHNAVVVTLAAEPSDALAVMSAIAGVAEVESLPHSAGLFEYRLLPQRGESIVARVSDAARDHGWQLEGLRVEQGRLDDVFRSITTGAAAAVSSAA